jgi:hypothetical protein
LDVRMIKEVVGVRRNVQPTTPSGVFCSFEQACFDE